MHTYNTVSGVRIALAAILVFLSSFSIPQGVITGRVLDDKNEPLNNAVISVYVNGALKTSDETDCDGMYSVSPLEPGSYDMMVVYPGYDSIIARSVVVGYGNATTLNFQMLKLKRHTVPQTWQGLKGKPVAVMIRGELKEAAYDEQKDQSNISVKPCTGAGGSYVRAFRHSACSIRAEVTTALNQAQTEQAANAELNCGSSFMTIAATPKIQFLNMDAPTTRIYSRDEIAFVKL